MLQISPCNPLDNVRNRRRVHAQKCSPLLLATSVGAGLTDCKNVRSSQFCLRMKRSAMHVHRCAAFGVHVTDVVALGAKEKMLRSNTAAVVAAVTDKHAGRDRPKMKLPRNAVGLFRMPPADCMKMAITGRIKSARPFPTPVALLHLRPKTLGQAWSRGVSGTVVSPPLVVHGAPATYSRSPGAVFDRTGRLSGHRGFLRGVTRQGVSAPLPLSIVSDKRAD